MKVSPIKIKAEPAESIEELDNFIDVSQIMHFNPFQNSPVILQNCSVKLDRCLAPIVKEDPEIQPTPEELKTEDTHNDDSDFEWPLHDDEMLSDVPENKPQVTSTHEIDSDYNPRYGCKPIQQPILKKCRLLPAYLITPEILVHPEDSIVIEGVEYKIPRRDPNIPVEAEKIYRTNRRPHRFHDTEGEKKIAAAVEMKCHECGEKVENFMRVRKHFKEFHKGQKGKKKLKFINF